MQMSDNFDDDDYGYNEAGALKADAAASRLNENGAYVGTIKRAEAMVAKTGTKGVTLTFDSPGNGSIDLTLYTIKKGEDGKPIELFGKAQLDAIMFLLGLKSLKAEAGKVSVWSDAEGKRVEEEGKVYPELCNKPIGIVLQKELYTKDGGGTGERMNLAGLFQAETKLMMSEIKERKTTPVKLDRLTKNLKNKDSRKAGAAEPPQPGVGAVPDGGY